MIDHDSLIDKYSSLEENWSPAVHALHARQAEMRARGQVDRAPQYPLEDGENDMLGLDDDFRPFPVEKKHRPIGWNWITSTLPE